MAVCQLFFLPFFVAHASSDGSLRIRNSQALLPISLGNLARSSAAAAAAAVDGLINRCDSARETHASRFDAAAREFPRPSSCACGAREKRRQRARHVAVDPRCPATSNRASPISLPPPLPPFFHIELESLFIIDLELLRTFLFTYYFRKISQAERKRKVSSYHSAK